MKICFLTHAFPPAETAAASYSNDFVNELVDNGFEVVVVTTRRNGSAKAVEKRGGLSVYRTNLELPIFADYFEFMTKVSPVIENIHKKEDFELMHSEHLFPAPSAGLFAKKQKIPHVLTIEGVSNVSLYSKMLFQLHKFLLPRMHFDVLASWGRYILDKYFLKWGIEESKCMVIPGAVDTKRFSPNVDGKTVRERLVDAEKIIFTAKPMYLTNALGIAHIIRAMEIVSKENFDCKLVIGGTGRMLNKLQNLTDKLNLNGTVKFIGWVPQKQMPNYYRAADIIVDSFIFSHPGSVTVLESLASGTPNVLTEIECLPGENNVPTLDIAMLAKRADHESIAQGILNLIEDKALGKKLGKNARTLVEKEFSVKKVTDSYINLYNELMV